MILRRLTLRNFRNYESALFMPEEGLSLLVGKNAQGKTNLLEAIFLCCTGRSHKTSHDVDMIREKQDFGQAECESVRYDGSHEVCVTLRRKGRKEIRVNGSGAKRLGELMGHITAVMFSPEDLMLLKQGPGERRRFLDMAISQLRPAYFYALQKYHRALRQRNLLLREGKESYLQPFEEQLARLGGVIIGHREGFVAELAEQARLAHGNICAQAEALEAEYCPSRKAVELQDALLSRREQDMRMGTTSVGPHRDDLLLRIDGKDTRIFASQGQQRTAALSLKIAQLRLMEREMGEPPLLMLDDVLSELDQQRQFRLFEAVEGVQMIISCTDATLLPKQGRVFRVEQGKLLVD